MKEKKTEILCPAKINLALDVLRRREDGYHDVCMVMQEIKLCDTLILTLGGEGISLHCDSDSVPTDRKNLAFRAAELFFEEAGYPAQVVMRLQKRIPVGAGLAGGSTDAAGALLGLNDLFDGPFSPEQLKELGGRLGADVPFCLQKGCALAEGIGTDLTPLPMPPAHILVLAKPPFSVSTAEVYGGLRLDERTRHPNMREVAAGLRQGDWARILAHSGNVLEERTAALHPEIREYEEVLYRCGAEYAQMSGSGPSVFGIFFERSRAEEAAAQLREKTEEVFVL